MEISYIFYLFSLIGVILFLTKNYLGFLAVFLLLTYSFLGLLDDHGSRVPSDAVTMMCLIILTIQFLSNNNPFKCNNDAIAKFILIIVGYVLVRSLFTVLFREEEFGYAFKVFRNELFLLSYFVLRQIPLTIVLRFIKWLFPITLFAGLIYIPSLLTRISTGQGYTINRSFLIATTAPLLFLTITERSLFRVNRLYQIALFLLLFSSVSRGYVLATGLAFVVYYIFVNRELSRAFTLLFFLAFFLIAFSYLDNFKSEGTIEGGTRNELSAAIHMRSFEDYERGSFMLRYALIWERADYLVKKPTQLLLGVGSIHEDSPNNRFNFSIGSARIRDGKLISQMIDTDDVALLSHWLRYGSIYVILFFCLLISIYKTCKNRLYMPCMTALLLLLIVFCIDAVSRDSFATIQSMFMFLLLLSRTQLEATCE